MEAIQPQFTSEGYLLTSPFMGSFVHVFEMKAIDDSRPEYSIEMVMAPDNPSLALMTQMIQKVAGEKWGSNLPSNFRNPIRPGNDRAAKYPEFAGMYTIKASDKARKPLVVDRNRAEVLDRSTIYSGAIYRAVLDCYAYDTKGNCGVSFGLKCLQKIEDGTPLSGGPNVDPMSLPALPPIQGMAPQMPAPGQQMAQPQMPQAPAQPGQPMQPQMPQAPAQPMAQPGQFQQMPQAPAQPGQQMAQPGQPMQQQQQQTLPNGGNVDLNNY